jgi:hypothetical protein
MPPRCTSIGWCTGDGSSRSFFDPEAAAHPGARLGWTLFHDWRVGAVLTVVAFAIAVGTFARRRHG